MKWRLLILMLVAFSLSACKRFFINVSEDFANELWEERPESIACFPMSAVNPIENNELTFDENHLLCISIEMEESDFEIMRYESRFGPDVRHDNGTTATATAIQNMVSCDTPYPDEYNWYNAKFVVDNVTLDNVGIRKKGFLGSIFSIAPSIKITTDRNVANQKIGNTKRVTLNNNAEDPTRLRHCINYRVFEMANYPAPRTNLANVSVNGEALGIYTHIEAVDEQFLNRAFGNANGDLYEGQLIDFVDDWLPRWDAKTDATDETAQPILNLCTVLETATDENLITELNQYLNIERFIQFWALEILVNHTDGYSLNRNNFFIYFDPNDSNRATFIPWGMNSFDIDEPEITRFVAAEIPRRLSRIPETKMQLENEVNRLLTEVWDETELIRIIDTFSPQVKTGEVNPIYDELVLVLKDWVNERRITLQEMMANGLPEGSNIQTMDCSGY